MPSLRQYHTFGVEVQARELIELRSEADIAKYLQLPVKKVLLGGGADVLFTQDFDGIVAVMRTKGVSIREDETNYYVEAAAGEVWHDLILSLISQGIAGLENLALIPGTCGAAPVQNIGAYGVEFKDFCDYVKSVDGDGEYVDKCADCAFGYRDSRFKHEWIGRVITAIGLVIPKKWTPRLEYGALAELKGNAQSLTAKDVLEKVIEIRNSKLPDPKVLGNAGSFFQNPIVSRDVLKVIPEAPFYDVDREHVKIPAAWLIDQCGLKGYSIGGAKVYERQPLIIVNKGNATAGDIYELSQHVIAMVRERFGITLCPEVRFIS